MIITEWRIHYKRPEQSDVLVVGFSSREEAEAYLADETTDAAIHCKLGWRQFDRIEEVKRDLTKFADLIRAEIEAKGKFKDIYWGASMDAFYKQMADELGCDIKHTCDHFDNFIALVKRK